MIAHDFNLDVECVVFGKKRLTEDEMRAEAEKVWKEQPSVMFFWAGFQAHRDSNGRVTFAQDARNFLGDPSQDYEVLQHVRKWMYSRRAMFARELSRLWGRVNEQEAWPDRALRYEVGDYARAAFVVVRALHERGESATAQEAAVEAQR